MQRSGNFMDWTGTSLLFSLTVRTCPDRNDKNVGPIKTDEPVQTDGPVQTEEAVQVMDQF